MTAIFIKIFNMSLTAGLLVLVVMAIRPLMKKAPKWIRLILWSFVALRLVCPFSIESIFSLVPKITTTPTTVLENEITEVVTNTPNVNQSVGSLAPTVENSVNPMQIVLLAAAIVWIVGILAMLTYMIVSYVNIKKKVNEAVKLQDNILICDRIDTPFILGVIKPKIYMPANMEESDTEYVIAHENAHIERLDYLWKPFGFLLLSVYWFNPILWVAYILLCRDIELACDEKVIKELGAEIKKPYSEALVNCSVSRKAISACPLAFGENSVKARIKSILAYKKSGVIITSVAVLVVAVVAVCFLTNRKEPEKKPASAQTESNTSLALTSSEDMTSSEDATLVVSSAPTPLSSAPVVSSQSEYVRDTTELTAEQELRIKNDYIKQYLVAERLTVDDIKISEYYGTYNGAIIMWIDGPFSYMTAIQKIEVAGYIFSFSSSHQYEIWKDGEFCGIKKAYEKGWLTVKDIREFAEIIYSNIPDNEEKMIYPQPSKYGEHGDDCVIVAFKKKINSYKVNFTLEDFSEIDAEAVEYLRGFGNDDETNKTVKITLKTKTIENVFKAIRELEKRNDVLYVEPKVFYHAD